MRPSGSVGEGAGDGSKPSQCEAERSRRLTPGVILLIAWVIFLIFAFPGQVTQDSFDHFHEGRLGIYSDAHPPAVTALVRLCDRIVAGPLLVVVFQSGLFLVGLYAILVRFFATSTRAAWATLGIFLFPPVMIVMAVVWKDCTMAAFLVVGIAGLLADGRRAQLLALVALLAATAMRYNAFGATFAPILLLFQWRTGMPWAKRYAIAIAAWLAVTLGAFALNAALTDKPMHYWHSSIAIYDIVGTLANVDEDLPDAELAPALAGTQLLVDRELHGHMRRLYSPRDFWRILRDPQPLWAMPINGFEPAPRAQREAIERAYKTIITDHLGAYLVHRARVMHAVLVPPRSTLASTIVKRDIDPYRVAEFGFANRATTLQRWMTHSIRGIARGTPLFVPWIYAVLAIAAIALARRRAILALALSGIGMEASLIPLVHNDDYRYSHWMVVATLLALVATIVHRSALHVSGRSPSPGDRRHEGADTKVATSRS